MSNVPRLYNRRTMRAGDEPTKGIRPHCAFDTNDVTVCGRSRKNWLHPSTFPALNATGVTLLRRLDDFHSRLRRVR